MLLGFFPSPNSLKVDVCSFICCEDGADSEICRTSTSNHADGPSCCFPPCSQAGASLAAVHSPALRNRAASPNACPNALQPPRHQDGAPPPPPPLPIPEEMTRGQSWKPSAGRDTHSQHTPGAAHSSCLSPQKSREP